MIVICTNAHVFTSMHIVPTVGVIITSHPVDQTSNIGSNVSFTCEASGSQSIGYKWWHNNNELVNDPGHIEGSNTSMLMIINVTVTDWGIYTCEATNIVNNVTSNEATLSGECFTHYRTRM